jgi:LysM repeat protein
VKRTIQHPLSLVILLSLLLALSACVRPAPGSEGIDIAATATAAVINATVPPIPTQPEGLVLPATPTPLPSLELATATPEPQPVVVDPTAAPGIVLPTTHTVQPGETLVTISSIYNVPVADIQAANNITDPNALTVGQVLTIPAPGSIAVQPTVPATGEQVYVVQPGDNLFRIGLRFGFTAAELAAYNGIPDMTRIYVGQEIRIPAR